jgi:hypothetical protein
MLILLSLGRDVAKRIKLVLHCSAGGRKSFVVAELKNF